MSFEGEGSAYLDLEGRVFRSAANTANGEVDDETLFFYHQQGEVVWAEYEGGEVVKGQLLGRWRGDGKLEFAYHHLNRSGLVMAGTCLSVPEIRADGSLRLDEEWQWLTGDGSKGRSTIVEVGLA
ncbi:MAG: n-acetylglutamate synthase [Acidobacteria bacterium]|nr:n-acetylglutamate synthase [Acidobacteriota bacterium]